MKILLSTLLAVVIALISISDVSALMTSTNYRIIGDSVGGSGGRSSSAGYVLQATTGEEAAGEASSASYTLMTGFQSLSDHPTFTFGLSASTVALGTLTQTALSSGTMIITTSTNAPFGYTTTVVEDGQLRSGINDIDDVADGAVTIGVEEYGIGVSGSDAAFGTYQALSTTPLTVASRTTWKNDAKSTITYRAAIDSGTTSGSYAHTVTYISTGNF